MCVIAAMASLGGRQGSGGFAASVLLGASSAALLAFSCAAELCSLSGAALDQSSCQQLQETRHAARALATLAAEQVALLV